MTKSLWVIAATAASPALLFANGSNDARREQAESAMQAYAEVNYPLARKHADQASGTVEAKLIKALCDVYDRSKQDIRNGQIALEEILRNPEVPAELRADAGITLARTAQLMKERRDLYRNAADRYDHRAIYEEVIRLAPGTRAERDAFFYLIHERLEDAAESDAAFEDLERFLRDFTGDKTLLPPVHLLAEYEYIRVRDDYANAVRHLQAGYELGFANPSENRSGLFRIGFLYYKKLNNRPMAIYYFKEYLQRFPFSGQAVVAQRFLEELGEGQQ